MIWPWSRIRELERELWIERERNAILIGDIRLYRNIALQASRDIRGAHKGIKRLRDKLKKVTR